MFIRLLQSIIYTGLYKIQSRSTKSGPSNVQTESEVCFLRVYTIYMAWDSVCLKATGLGEGGVNNGLENTDDFAMIDVDLSVFLINVF